MADDDAALRDKLAALEAEVKADADAVRARKEAALAKLRAQRVAQAAVTKPAPAPEVDHGSEGIAGALELANKANRVKQELAKKPAKGEKSWIKSGVASLALGPVGWLYAGSLREAIPATAVWLALVTLASKILPTVLMWPVLMLVMPLSAIAGVVYALQYNRHGSRQRLFDSDGKKPKQLGGG